MKTIKEINSKWWYRLIKVVYVLTFVSIFTVLTIVIFTGYFEKSKNRNIRQAFEYAAENPTSDFAQELARLAKSGCLNDEAEKKTI